MKIMNQVIALLWIVVGAQLVGGSVYHFVATEILKASPGSADNLLQWVIIAGVAVWCSICFIMGAAEQARRWFRRTP